MQIEPLQPVAVTLKCNENYASSLLLELTDSKMKVSSEDYLDKDSLVTFKAQFFYGEAIVSSVQFQDRKFTYTLEIRSIKYQPGLLVNQKL
ncbi:hypothetical protein [Legionella jordanis]|uniref:Uncharacterized protein n=1 Tax=Legionella jordanis TaxID=456 RepID=A0A0W0VCF1_9GAMM|nr:hypothetical protein [Legionella jordanis]KTD17820.1 hypothetical protein Ljor_2126 [Legionella jordanis]RMX02477.1 hypothetical protein EAW55_09535 [Legionella jordanis]RMX21680.1 hypothetical protein EAS68_02685 [Legionella jordanis]VEH11243.1 Uncharacterised protein [Legionella jordanis]HAT8713789.1 hypothetical protein [Legionella jordanis]